jgi:hypothetical protein
MDIYMNMNWQTYIRDLWRVYHELILFALHRKAKYGGGCVENDTKMWLSKLNNYDMGHKNTSWLIRHIEDTKLVLDGYILLEIPYG